jgi:hypothetical protein
MSTVLQQLARTVAKQALERITPFGDETHVFDTIYLALNDDGTYSVTDNGDETASLDYVEAINAVVACVTEREEKRQEATR